MSNHANTISNDDQGIEPRKKWTIGFRKPTKALLNIDSSDFRVQCDGSIRLITRSGFEQKHIFTSRIASL